MKHKKLTMIVALVLVAALAAGLGIWATGEANIPTVTYYDGSDGTNAHFTFTHTGKGSDTNLFPNFSDCMPGDSLTQTIRVQADSKNGAQGAKIYLRAEIDGDASAKEGSAITYNDVLDHISMTVSKNGVVLASNKTAKLFSQLDAAEGLKSNVFIAEVSPKTDPVDLDVTIESTPPWATRSRKRLRTSRSCSPSRTTKCRLRRWSVRSTMRTSSATRTATSARTTTSRVQRSPRSSTVCCRTTRANRSGAPRIRTRMWRPTAGTAIRSPR